MKKRIVSFIILTIIAATGPVFLWIIGVAGYALYFGGLELLLLGALVDAYFMTSVATFPHYTVLSASLLVGLEFVKPYLLLYNQRNEV